MGDRIENKLKDETYKWLNRINSIKVYSIKNDELSKEMIKNIHAYIEDTSYFLKKGKLIEAFEAVIWAWAWLEIGERLGILERR